MQSSSSGSGYGYGAETSYGPPESSYGGPEYRSVSKLDPCKKMAEFIKHGFFLDLKLYLTFSLQYQEYEEVQDVVRSSPGQVSTCFKQGGKVSEFKMSVISDTQLLHTKTL